MWLRWLTRSWIPAVLAWFAVCLLLFYAVDLFLMPSVAGKFAKTVQVPKLLGMRLEKARASLHPGELSLMLDSSSDFSDVPAGRILSQFPDPGSTVKRGRRIWVRVSKGRHGITVPSLRGMSEQEAALSIRNAGLKLGNENYISTPDAPAGAVLGSHPGANAIVEKGQAVDLDVSGNAPASPSAPSVASPAAVEENQFAPADSP